MSKTLVGRIVTLCVLGCFALTAVACGGKDEVPDQGVQQGNNAPRDRSVVLYQYKFNPNTLTVPAGTTVTFTNKDPAAHNINIPALNVDNKIEPNQAWSHTFETTGEFAIGNRTTQAMTMTLIVE